MMIVVGGCDEESQKYCPWVFFNEKKEKTRQKKRALWRSLKKLTYLVYLLDIVGSH
jgi:hypothetical protein